MKTPKRKRTHIKDIVLEKKSVSLFCFMYLGPKAGAMTAVADIFDAYQNSLDSFKWKPTVLSIDGFGRMLPKLYKRKTAKVDGKIRRYVKDVVLIRG